MWYMELKISMSDKHHRHSKHTKFHQNLRGGLYNSSVIGHGMTQLQYAYVYILLFYLLVHPLNVDDNYNVFKISK